MKRQKERISMRKNLNECSIEDLLDLVYRKSITIDEVLNTTHTYEEYKTTYEWMNRCRWTNIRRNNYWKSVKERNDKTFICLQLTEAAERKKEADRIEKEFVENHQSQDLSMDWDLAYESERYETSVASIKDAFVMSLANKARVDISYISNLTNESKDRVIEELKGLIYQNPDTWGNDPYKGWETSDEYLSGNMSVKLKKAMEANFTYNGRFENNVKAINRIYPKLVEPEDIYITLGSPWIPTDVIDDFIVHLLGESDSDFRMMYLTKHDRISGTWETPNGSRYASYQVAYTRTWGTRCCPALRILENALNMRKPIVYDHYNGRRPDGSIGEIKKINRDETALAQEKQRQMIEEFQKWVWEDPQRKERLLQIYDDNYASFVRRRYDGSFLSFPGMNEDVELFDYQKNAVARILFSKNVLLAHDVGTGKTYEMVAAGMELKRIGLSRKNLYVVPNNILGQWEKTFKEIYPEAKLLVVGPKDFVPKKRQKTLKTIRDNEYDGIIMAYSCFDIIPLSDGYVINDLEEKKVEIIKAQATVSSNVGILGNRRKTINKKLLDLKAKEKKYDGICFDELGITRLFIDEAHNYKNVPIQTKMSMVLGVNASGSKKCQDMLDKVRYIQKNNNGGGVVMATGTPITNSITEAYIIQLYLQSGELSLLDLQSFDSWAGMFGETVSDYEIDVATNTYRYTTRFCRFHNLPELTNLLSNIADFHKAGKESGIPAFEGYSDLQIKKTAEFEDVLGSISKRADKVRNHTVSRKEDNMLKITTDGRKAALDFRLLDENKYLFDRNCKVMECARNILKEYQDGNADRSTQLVFCDSSTPKEGFNMYDELSRILVELGIPQSEIAYIHDAATDRQRNRLYELVRKGEIRVLIGSTFKLGLGVNVQERVKALHHLDIPWRPADMTQREGRILRQGNLNESVNIYRYVTEGSFDAYSWQLLETKQRFISDLLSGGLDQRDGDEIDDIVLSYGEIKALAIGNPLIKERVEIINELSRFRLLQSRSIAMRIEAQKELLELPSRISIQKSLIEKARQDYEFVKILNLVEIKDLSKAEKEAETDRRRLIREKIDEAITSNSMMPMERQLMDYNGFSIILPKNMSRSSPYLIVQRSGRYRIDLGESEKGNLIRLDNFFAGFNRTVELYEEDLKKLKERKKGLEEEVLKKDDTFEKVNELKINLNNINERLGLTDE